MVLAKFIRLANIRNTINFSNISVVGSTLNVRQHSSVTSKPATSIAIELTKLDTKETEPIKKEKKISKAMRIHLQKSKEYQSLIVKETIKYEVGKRHLANMMGMDADELTEKDIANAIRYLFPSGLYDWRARPLMLHPLKIFIGKKEVEFDQEGRPFHLLHYTCKPHYYEILHEIAENIKILNSEEEKLWMQKKLPTSENKIDLVGSDWYSKAEIENLTTEKLETDEYDYLIKSLERLGEHPMSRNCSDFIMRYRKILKSTLSELKLPDVSYDKDGRPFIIIKNCKRKTARGEVKVLGNGSGNITINGCDISYFENIQHREQVSSYTY